MDAVEMPWHPGAREGSRLEAGDFDIDRRPDNRCRSPRLSTLRHPLPISGRHGNSDHKSQESGGKVKQHNPGADTCASGNTAGANLPLLADRFAGSGGFPHGRQPRGASPTSITLSPA